MLWEYGLTNMGLHMKTTVEISDALLEAARQRARQQGTTLRALIEQGLRSVLDEPAAAHRFTLRDASVDGNGLQGDVREGDWERIVSRAYEGRGG